MHNIHWRFPEQIFATKATNGAPLPSIERLTFAKGSHLTFVAVIAHFTLQRYQINKHTNQDPVTSGSNARIA